MNNKEIREFRSRVDKLIGQRRLGDTFDVLRNAAKVVSSWKLSDRIEKAEQGYGYLLRYMVDGLNDPSRDDVNADLIREATIIRDMLVREMSIVETPTLYYNTLRSVNARHDESLQNLFAFQKKFADDSSLFNELASGASIPQSDILRSEMNERDIFNRLWVTFPISVDDSEATSEFLSDDSIPSRTRSLCVSALTLGLLEFYDERKLALLCDAYQSSDPHVSVRAIVGLAVVLDKYKGLELSPNITNRIAALTETPEWHSDIRRTVVEIIRTNDTGRVSSKLNNEIFPEIKRMSKEMSDRVQEIISENEDILNEPNPEWDEMLLNDKVKENLKELCELQMEGADVFMSTFASLKQFPFFNETANWFMPFDPEHSVLSSSGGNRQTPMMSMINSIPYICDSDKYSMALSMSMMPKSQFDLLASQLNSHSQELSEMLASTNPDNSPVDRKSEINNYVHSLYRFYHLFRRKSDFYNPFDHVINPFDIKSFSKDFNNDESMLSLGEFYFKTGLYGYASGVYTRLDEISEPEPARYQKLGFCYEKLGDFDKAVSYYEQADLLDDSNLWNLHRLEYVYRLTSQFSSAISACKRIVRLDPESLDTTIELGNLYILTKNYNDAVSELHKAEFISPDNMKILRPLARALMMSRRFEEAQNYYDRILSSDPSPVDLLNAGHIALVLKHLGEAINYYRLASERKNIDWLIESIHADAENLHQLGVGINDLPLVIDAVIYSLKN